MTRTLSVVLVLGFLLSGRTIGAQETLHYRGYALGSSLDAVSAASRGLSDPARTVHARPALIQELRWRPPYSTSAGTLPDPVREITFTFLDNALYRLIVSYDRSRTEGLTDADMLETLTTTYGTPASAGTGTQPAAPDEAFRESIVLGRWEYATSLVVLLRRTYGPEFQLLVMSPSLSARASAAIREAVRLDAAEAPQRESERRQKDADDASATQDKARTTNKPAFRP